MEFAKKYIQNLSNLYQTMVITDFNGNEIVFHDAFEQTVQYLEKTKTKKKKIMLIGNGGSAAIASHLQNDLSNLGIRAATFFQSSLMTAFSNDYGYDSAFERCTNLWTDPDDLYVAISSSGNSSNILRGVQSARIHKNIIITLSGFKADNQLRSLGDINYFVPRAHYGLVETTHSILAHCMIDYYLSKNPMDA